MLSSGAIIHFCFTVFCAHPTSCRAEVCTGAFLTFFTNRMFFFFHISVFAISTAFCNASPVPIEKPGMI